jgi:succinate CoA transferase
MNRNGAFPILSADEAAELIDHNAMVAFSGFTPAGAAKAVPLALASRARELHTAGQPYQIRVLTGASTGQSLDDALAEADAISWRAPYQSSAPLRERINDDRVAFVDMHLSHVPQSVLFGFFGKIDFAVIEASRVTPDGRVFLTNSIGASPTFLQAADKVIIELNRSASSKISEMADIVIPKPPPFRPALDLDYPLQRIGKTYARVDPEKIVGIVETDKPDELIELTPPNSSSSAIARHVVHFLLEEMASGRIPPHMLPIQSGVGNVANAVLSGLGKHPDIPELTMYTEVFQSAAFELMTQEKIGGASTTALALTQQQMADLIDEIDYYAPRLVLRPQEISNNPAAVRQVGVIALNTALEFDLSGHVNSTHVMGRMMVNGIGGSGDFARNAYLSIFMCPSTAKDGRISTVVPMSPHVDHNEHSVNVVVTEQGLADLRGLAPEDRALRIIDECAHPHYRDYLHDYIRRANPGHIRHDLSRCFELHQNLLRYGAMLPDSPMPSTAAWPVDGQASPHLQSDGAMPTST